MKNLAKKLIVARLNTKVRKLLATHKITIIGVTGSVGKTSAKHAIGEVLGATRQVRYTEDSYNTDIGIPLSIFGLKVPGVLWDARSWAKIFRGIDKEIAEYQYDTVVLELAEDELNMMMKLQRIVPLDIGVLTEVSPAHMDKMGDIGKVLHDSWKIVAGAKTVLYNADNEKIRRKAYKNGTVGFGLTHGDVRFGKISRASSGLLKAELKIGKQKKMVQTHMVGEQNLYALLAAAAVADKLDIPFEAICFELEQIRPVAGRMNLLASISGARLIDDSYNASPFGVTAALDTLAQMKGRKIAVLGNMNELGQMSPQLHEEVGRHAAGIVDLLVVIGPHARDYLASAAEQAGLAGENVKRFRTPYEAGHYLKNIVTRGDTVLVKGSQNKVFSEEVSRILLDPKLEPSKVLVRQSKEWRRKKKKSFAL